MNPRYEMPFWKAFIKNEAIAIFSPETLFMLLFFATLLGIFFTPLTYITNYFDIINSWYSEAVALGVISLAAYFIGKTKSEHYVIRESLRLLDEGKIDDAIAARLISAAGRL